LSTNVNISNRVAELKAAAAERAIITTEILIDEAADIQRRALAARKYSPANSAPVSKAKLAGLLPAPAPDDAMRDLDLSRLSDEQLDALETILAVARGETPPTRIDLKTLSDSQLAVLRRAREILGGKEAPGTESAPETVGGAVERIASKINDIGERADTLGATDARDSELAKFKAEVGALTTLNEALERRLAYAKEVEAA
jgi:hypothetical protein